MASLVNSFWGAAGVGGLPIDNLEAVYSLRKVINTATYSIKIRRDSDDATTDVELDDSGSLTLSSTVSAGGTLGTWVGANNGFIDTWYNQLSSSFFANATIGSGQPQIITAGVLEVENSLATIQFGDPTRLTVNGTIPLTNFSIYGVCNNTSWDNISYLVAGTSSGCATGGTNASNPEPLSVNGAGLMTGATVRPSGHKLFEWYNDEIYFDDATDTPYGDDTPLTALTVKTLGGRPDLATLNFLGNAQEILIYSTNRSASDRSDIHDNLATYYGVT